MVTEEFARLTFAGDRALALVAAIESGWAEYTAEGRRRHRRARANVVWDNIVEHAQAPGSLGSMAGVLVARVNDTPIFLFDEDIALRFKMFDRENLPRNLRTRVQARIQDSGRLPSMPQRDLLFAGYRLDAAEAEIEKVLLVRVVGGQVEWSLDLRELASGVLIPAKPILPGLPPTLAPLPRISRPASVEEGGLA